MEFIEFKEILQGNFVDMTKDTTHLFEVGVDKDELWNTYLNSFPAGSNKKYRERTEHDCSCCRQFIKNIGNAVVVYGNQVYTIWDLHLGDSVYQPVTDAMAAFIRSHVVSDVWINKEKKIGTDFNHEKLDSGKIAKWEHFYLELPDKFVDRSNRSVADIQGGYRDTKNVFKRSLDEIKMDALDSILELIDSNTLYKGEEWKSALKAFQKYKKQYDKLNSDEAKNLYTWEKSIEAGISVGRIRNHSIGTLLVNVSKEMDLDLALKKYEQIVAPSNYKRPKAIFTKKMLEEAKNKIEELGLSNSLERRYATIDDITVNNILFSNKDVAKKIDNENMFDALEKDISSNPKKFSRVEEVDINMFIEKILLTAKEIEIMLENKHVSNMVSLIAPVNKESKTMFKWDNAFGWAYSGNITDSMKELVKSAGGNVDGDLRFSIQWNDGTQHDRNDLDAHCIEPSKEEICFRNKNSRTGGKLDVDITNPSCGKTAIENITWNKKSDMKSGTYLFFVHQYGNRGGKGGFRAEIEFDGMIHSFDYNKELRQGEKVDVAEVTLHSNGAFEIKSLIPSSASSKEVWNLKTNQFVPVSVVMFSPNYWNEQTGIGHKHYFFMLKDCKNNESPNGMFNEYLREDLLTHKRVFEALGSKCRVEDSEEQLSGVGFSSTKRADLIVKVKGATERVMKIKF